MSNLHCVLHWLFPTGAAVAEWVAAIATGCLVGAGFIQLRAIRDNNDELKRQAEEQRERWRREDAIRVEENKPKYRFGIVLEESGAHLWVGNIGVTSFIVKTVFVNRTDIRVEPRENLPPAPLEWNEVVAKGKKKMFAFPRELWSGDLFRSTRGPLTAHDCEISMSLECVDSSAITDKNRFTMYSENGSLSLHKISEYWFEEWNAPKKSSHAAADDKRQISSSPSRGVPAGRLHEAAFPLHERARAGAACSGHPHL